MSLRRRTWLLGAATATLLPAACRQTAPVTQAEAGPADELPSEASLQRRYAAPLRLPGSGGWMAPVRARDITRLAARPTQLPLRGRRPTPLWAYVVEVAGRTVFNPIIVARPGDRLACRFDNLLPQPTIVHWHGLTNDQHNDGGGMLTAASGGHHDYDWTVRNGAGLHWYHPHPHGQAGEQLWRGLSGLFIVEDEGSDRLARSLNLRWGENDLPLVLQDRSISRLGEMPYGDAERGRLTPKSGVPLSANEAERAISAAVCSTTPAGGHGAYGDDILVNGTRYPCVALPREWVRLRILNACNARIYRLALVQAGVRPPFVLLGLDGAPLPEPHETTELLLAPAQRADIAIDLRRLQPGDAWLKTLPFDPMHGEGVPRRNADALALAPHAHGARGEGTEEPILRLDVRESGHRPGRLLHGLAEAPGSAPAAAAPGMERLFLLDRDDAGRWTVNGAAMPPLDLPAFSVAAGTTETWTLRNAARGMPHPMHLHGFSFEVLQRRHGPVQFESLALDARGRTAADLAVRDTVLVWPGETVRLRIPFASPFPGEQRYMFHCHNLEHEDGGMMLPFSVAT